MLRLIRAIPNTKQHWSGRERRGIILELGPVSWEEFTVLNEFPDIRTKYADYNSLYAHGSDLRWCRLSNLLVLGVMPLTIDGFGLVQQRGPEQSIDPGLFTCGIAENIHRFLDEAPPDDPTHRIHPLTEVTEKNRWEPYRPRGKPSPLLAAQRGIWEELSRELHNQTLNPERFRFLALAAGRIFRVEVMGPRNRLGKLTPAINFREALDEGHIILANLSGGPRASDKSCELLGRLLTRFLFFNAQRRRHPERPFFFYLDECQLYLSGDVSRMLAEARKYGVGVILAHQYLWQLEKAGEDILHAVRNATNLKAFFRIKDAKEAADHAETSIPLDLEMPLKASTRPTSVGVELVKLGSESTTEQESR